jgi:hypothetical protein
VLLGRARKDVASAPAKTARVSHLEKADQNRRNRLTVQKN